MKYYLFIVFGLLNLYGISIASYSVEADPLPTDFDSRTKWPRCVVPIQEQKTCNASASFGVTEVISARMCIQNNDTAPTILSAQYLEDCFGYCNGASASSLFNYASTTGIVTDSCISYTGTVSSCPHKCNSGDVDFTQYKCTNVKTITGTQNIQQEIITNGPVYCSLIPGTNFQYYKSGVYFQSSPIISGAVGLSIIGWGVEDGINFWIAQNSEGEYYGENGYLRINLDNNNFCQTVTFCTPQSS